MTMTEGGLTVVYFVFIDEYAINPGKEFLIINKPKEVYKALLSKDCNLVFVSDDYLECKRLIKGMTS